MAQGSVHRPDFRFPSPLLLPSALPDSFLTQPSAPADPSHGPQGWGRSQRWPGCGICGGGAIKDPRQHPRGSPLLPASPARVSPPSCPRRPPPPPPTSQTVPCQLPPGLMTGGRGTGPPILPSHTRTLLGQDPATRTDHGAPGEFRPEQSRKKKSAHEDTEAGRARATHSVASGLMAQLLGQRSPCRTGLAGHHSSEPRTGDTRVTRVGRDGRAGQALGGPCHTRAPGTETAHDRSLGRPE